MRGFLRRTVREGELYGAFDSLKVLNELFAQYVILYGNTMIIIMLLINLSQIISII